MTMVLPKGFSPRLRLPRANTSMQLVLGLAMVAALVVATLVWGLNPPASAINGDLLTRLSPPGSPGHLFGSDQLGRDLIARTAGGLPWSMGIALVATLISAGLGALAGLAAAWRPGPVRTVLNHLTDTIIAFPSLVIAVTVIAILGRGFWPLSITLGLATWPIVGRVVYAEALALLKREYVLAAQLFGVSGVRILATHVLPGIRPSLLVALAFTFADMLIAESALSFLGLGAPLSAPSWGNMLADSRQYLFNAPWMMLVPAAAIVFAVVALNLVGDGVATLSRRRARAIEH